MPPSSIQNNSRTRTRKPTHGQARSPGHAGKEAQPGHGESRWRRCHLPQTQSQHSRHDVGTMYGEEVFPSGAAQGLGLEHAAPGKTRQLNKERDCGVRAGVNYDWQKSVGAQVDLISPAPVSMPAQPHHQGSPSNLDVASSTLNPLPPSSVLFLRNHSSPRRADSSSSVAAADGSPQWRHHDKNSAPITDVALPRRLPHAASSTNLGPG
ncbi:hypothetical protein CDD83_9048 [Cordyceps sp. RAO-2017]|nr:hypothetical protein CDD83_9048 [Cordyceps sp. RAO-2017]